MHKTLCPLVALQPIYMHPYAAAKMVASIGHLYGRRVYLNMLAGGFKNDLESLNDHTSHDKRYERMTEYTLIVKKLLGTTFPVSFEGEFYRVNKLKMNPPLQPHLFPGILVSGSSEAGLAASKAVDATPVRYPKPASEYGPGSGEDFAGSGIRVGIIARDREEEAWRVATERFPDDRRGQITHELAMKVSDSVWHKQLSDTGSATCIEESPYWLGPFMNYKTFCPYLVGSYQRVSDEIARYIGLGADTLILDVPPDEEELRRASLVFAMALGCADHETITSIPASHSR